MAALGRLLKRSDFLAIAAKGRKYATPGLVLQAYAPAPDRSGIRVGFTASRRVGGAVERNRAKRRLRAAARDVLPRCAAAGTDYVLIARSGTTRRPYRKLVADLCQALRQVGAVGRGDTDPDAAAHDGSQSAPRRPI